MKLSDSHYRCRRLQRSLIAKRSTRRKSKLGFEDCTPNVAKIDLASGFKTRVLYFVGTQELSNWVDITPT